MPKPPATLPVITTTALPSSLPSHGFQTGRNSPLNGSSSEKKRSNSPLRKRAQTPAVPGFTSTALFQTLCSLTPGSPDAKTFFTKMRKGQSELSNYSEAIGLTLLYDVFRTLWGQHIGKGFKFQSVQCTNVVEYLSAPFHKQKARANAAGRNPRFLVKDAALAKMASRSDDYQRFRVVNYPAGTIYPAAFSDLQAMTPWAVEATDSIAPSIFETLVYRLLKAFLVGTTDENGEVQLMAFVPHKYCT